MSRAEALVTLDSEAARQEIKANGGEVVFDFGAGVLVARLPASVDPAKLRSSSLHQPAALDEQPKRLLDAWKVSRPAGAEDAGASPVRLEHGCVSTADVHSSAREERAGVRGLRGRIAVVFVIVTGPAAQAISEPELVRVRAEALAALGFLRDLNPVAEIEFVIEDHFVGVQSTTCSGQACAKNEDCEQWLFDAMGKLGFTSDRAGVRSLANRAQLRTGASTAYVAAFTRYPVCQFAYAEPGSSLTVIGYTTGPMSIGLIHNFFAHESCHIFEACDEEPQAGSPMCGVQFGELAVPNHNSAFCSWSNVGCLMKAGALLEMCEFTRWQMGWNNRTMERQVIGPSGGLGGGPFYLPFSRGARIVELTVNYGSYVNDLIATAEIPAVGRVTQTIGTSGGPNTKTLALDADERIVAVSGKSGLYVDSLTVHTNKRGAAMTAGGSGGSVEYRYDIPEDRDLSGFVGRAGSWLDAIGVILDPRAASATAGTIRRSGPSGGWKTMSFADTPPAGGRVTKVVIHHGLYVDSIGVTYDTGLSSLHGGIGGTREELVLDPGEFIIGIAGRCGELVDSIIIQTNKRFSKRFGGSGGTVHFDHVCWPNEELAGFFGKAATLLVAIGCIFRRRA